MTTNRDAFNTGFIFQISKPNDPYAPRVSSHTIYQANSAAAKAELEKKFKPSLGYVLTLNQTVAR